MPEGGRANMRIPKAVPKAPKTLDDVVTYASWVADQTALGNLDPRAAREITNALRQFQSAIEKRDVERQVKELKTQLRGMKKRRVALTPLPPFSGGASHPQGM